MKIEINISEELCKQLPQIFKLENDRTVFKTGVQWAITKFLELIAEGKTLQEIEKKVNILNEKITGCYSEFLQN